MRRKTFKKKSGLITGRRGNIAHPNASLGVGIYTKAEEFVPIETAVDQNGDIFIADGDGAQHNLHYDRHRKLLNHFGGRGEHEANLDNAHGICIDTLNQQHSLLVTDRTCHCFK